MKILVTGGAGYIGSHTIIELYQSGYTPIIIDNLCNSSIRNIEGINKITKKEITWYNVDCTNNKKIKEIFRKEDNIIGVIHFAAFKSPEESIRNPEKYYYNNIKSLEVILDNMICVNIKKIIFSSSCTVYGSPEILPISEETPLNEASSPYGETKQKCEEILKSFNTDTISLRYFNPIGTHPSSLIGDCSKDKPINLVPIISKFAIGYRKELIINGNDYNTDDGTCVRDYIHVIDLAKSHVKALNFLLNQEGHYAFNIGTGKGLSVLEVIKTFEKSNNIKLDYKIGKRREGDIDEIYADNKLAKKILNWEARKTIEEAMIDAWNWEKRISKL